LGLNTLLSQLIRSSQHREKREGNKKQKTETEEEQNCYNDGNLSLSLFIMTMTIIILCFLSFNNNHHDSTFHVNGQTENQVAPLYLSINTPFAYDPQMAVSADNNVFIVWSGSATGSGDTDIYFSKSTDGGKTFTPPIIMSTSGSQRTGSIVSPGIQQEARIATSGSNVYIIWSDYSAGPAQLIFVKSIDNGTTFSNPIPLGTVFAAAGETRLAALDDNVYVAWVGSADNVHAGSVLSRTSNDYGASFGETRSISGLGVASMPEIATSSVGDAVYITWFNTTISEDGTVVNNDILVSKSTDAGQNFSEPKNISQSPDQFSVRPQIVVVTSSNTSSVSSIDREASSSLSSSSSTSSMSEASISPYSDTLNSPLVHDDGSREARDSVYLVWLESGMGGKVDIGDVFFSMSPDSGESFITPINLSNNTLSSTHPNLDPRIAVSEDGNDVFVVWSHLSAAPAVGRISTRAPLAAEDASVGYGANVFDPQGERLGGEDSTQKSSDDTGRLNSEIFMATSSDGGKTFARASAVSNNISSSIDPTIMVLPDSDVTNATNVLTMWQDNSSNDLGVSDIFLKSIKLDSSDDGKTNERSQIHVLRTPGSDILPQMAIVSVNGTNTIGSYKNELKGNNYNLIITWTENNSGYFGIFITRVGL
jgi:hypothetical protein